jgi:hypothetical protein
MSFRKMLLVATTALAISILAAGCGQATELTAQEVVTKVINAYSSVQTVKMDSTMSMTMETTGGEESLDVQMDMVVNGSMNVKDTGLSLTMTMDMDIPVIGKQTISSDVYIVDDWVYTKVDVPGVGDRWIKTKLDSAAWAQQDQLARQIEFLKTAIAVTSAGSETVDGVECYVLEIKPDMAMLMAFITSQMGQEAHVDLPEDVDFAEMFKSLTIKEWIAKDSYLPVKADMQMVMEINAEDLGETSADFDKMTMDMSVVMKYSDYNQPVTIVLPAEAANAIEQPLTR